MTLKELKERVKAVHKIGYNNYKVTIVFRGKEYTCDSNNSMAWDAIEEPSWGSSNILYYTEKQAYQALYDECKRKNQIGEYKI